MIFSAKGRPQTPSDDAYTMDTSRPRANFQEKKTPIYYSFVCFCVPPPSPPSPPSLVFEESRALKSHAQGGGGGGYSCFAYLSYLTIDQGRGGVVISRGIRYVLVQATAFHPETCVSRWKAKCVPRGRFPLGRHLCAEAFLTDGPSFSTEGSPSTLGNPVAFLDIAVAPSNPRQCA